MNDHRGTGNAADPVVAFFYDRDHEINSLLRAIATRELRLGEQHGGGRQFTWDDVEDVVQDACLAVIEAVRDGRIHGPLEPFAKQVLRHKLIDLWRRPGPELSLDQPLRPDDGEGRSGIDLLEDNPGSSGQLGTALVLATVRQALPRGVVRRAAELLVAVDFDPSAATRAIVADDPDCTPGAARERLRAARAALRQAVGTT